MVDDYSRAIQLDEDYASAYSNRSVAYTEPGNPGAGAGGREPGHGPNRLALNRPTGQDIQPAEVAETSRVEAEPQTPKAQLTPSARRQSRVPQTCPSDPIVAAKNLPGDLKPAGIRISDVVG